MVEGLRDTQQRSSKRDNGERERDSGREREKERERERERKACECEGGERRDDE